MAFSRFKNQYVLNLMRNSHEDKFLNYIMSSELVDPNVNFLYLEIII